MTLNLKGYQKYDKSNLKLLILDDPFQGWIESLNAVLSESIAGQRVEALLFDDSGVVHRLVVLVRDGEHDAPDA